MTSGTPESTQNWVLPGFQNSLDLASMSPLEAKAMSSSATVTSASGGHLAPPPPAASAPGTGAAAPPPQALLRPPGTGAAAPSPQHIRALVPGTSVSARLVQP